ncbi:MAG TPA: hypothetical protein VL049_07870, partial [Candidatus Dormibacteraeota bacterium]|nr:hypothetical protein [Candidatus Dormibacteraeota bacterium]
MSLPRTTLIVARIGLVFVGLLVATLLAEGAARLRDRQPLFSRHLGPVAPVPGSLPLDAGIGGGPLPADVHAEWLAHPPSPRQRPPDPLLVARAAQAERNGAVGFQSMRLWNAEMARLHGCDPGSSLRRQPQPIAVFDSPPGADQVPFRYPANSSLPGGLVTNRFGFRGPDVPIDKPPATIRIAFVGASTTVGLWNLPWSYPELVLHWLNVWATENRLPVRFDGINAGREGIGSGAIVAVTAQEVVPLEPDLVVYYEGANQSLCTGPAADAPPRPTATDRLATLDALASRWQDVSQLARRVRG